MTNIRGWRSVSDQILRDLANIPVEDRLKFLQEKILLLPEDQREMVAHFVSLGATFGADASAFKETSSLSRHRHISLVTAMAVIVAILLVIAGLYLVSLNGDEAQSKIDFWGASIETNSVGVACLGLAGLVFLFVARKAIAKM
jgi:hypothetical protein